MKLRGIAQESQAHFPSVGYKFTFSQESRCHVTGDGSDLYENKILPENTEVCER